MSHCILRGGILLDKTKALFVCAHNSIHSRQLGGTGLGLSIVKHIIELHSGSVGVQSTEGLGSRFWFTLPIF